jgi:hypothetical protein
MTEAEIQIAVVKYIEACARPGVLCIHPPNGGKRSVQWANKLKIGESAVLSVNCDSSQKAQAHENA